MKNRIVHSHVNCRCQDASISEIVERISALKDWECGIELDTMFSEMERALYNCAENIETDMYCARDCVTEIAGLYLKFNRKMPEFCSDCLGLLSGSCPGELIEGNKYPFYYYWNW